MCLNASPFFLNYLPLGEIDTVFNFRDPLPDNCAAVMTQNLLKLKSTKKLNILAKFFLRFVVFLLRNLLRGGKKSISYHVQMKRSIINLLHDSSFTNSGT